MIAKIPVVIHAATSENLFIIGATIAIKVNDIAKVKDHSLGIIVAPKTPKIVAICHPDHSAKPLPRK